MVHAWGQLLNGGSV